MGQRGGGVKGQKRQGAEVDGIWGRAAGCGVKGVRGEGARKGLGGGGKNGKWERAGWSKFDM